jgi:hypothetical protein
MPQVEFEPMIPTIKTFQRANISHALDRAATVIGVSSPYSFQVIIY